MSAEVAVFGPYLQEPLDAGAITSAEAYALEVELLARQHVPWEPENFALHQRAALWHWPAEGQPVH